MDLSRGYNYHDHEVESYNEQYNEKCNNIANKKKFKQICLHNAVYAISNDIDNYFSHFEPKEQKVLNVVNLISELNISK